MDPLSRLFGNPARLKLLRLFVFNDDTVFSLTDAAFRSKTAKEAARKEMTVLVAAGLIRKKSGKQGSGYTANKKSAHYVPLKIFLRDTTDVSDSDILTMLRKAGTVRVVALSGLFTGALEPKIDLLVVGDRLEEKPLANAIHTIEAELGRELRFASFTTEEFKYRVGVYDRLVRDVFDYPHRTILDRISANQV
ncbi:MAG: seg [Parcubacteria group bacterium]|nr:seg [Parcubacteria group bacterium]